MSFLVLSVALTTQSFACVNLDINVGTLDSSQGRMFAEILSIFIHERTGTKSIIKYYPDRETLHRAIAAGEVGLIVAEVNGDLQSAKDSYRSDMQLVMLTPIGGSADTGSFQAPVLAKVVLEKFPALPRLLKKLSGKIDQKSADGLLASVQNDGKKLSRVAKDFLVSKRLI